MVPYIVGKNRYQSSWRTICGEKKMHTLTSTWESFCNVKVSIMQDDLDPSQATFRCSVKHWVVRNLTWALWNSFNNQHISYLVALFYLNTYKHFVYNLALRVAKCMLLVFSIFVSLWKSGGILILIYQFYLR